MGFNILVDSTGRVVCAGFSDFSDQAVGGLTQIENVGGAIPPDIRSMTWNGKALIPAPVQPDPPPAPSVTDQLAALWEFARRSGLKPDANAAPGTPEKVLADLIAAGSAPASVATPPAAPVGHSAAAGS